MKCATLWVLAGIGVGSVTSGTAEAALTLNVDDITLQSPATDFTGFLEVYFTETTPSADENLASINFRADLTGTTSPSGTGVRFGVPPTTANGGLKPTVHTWVFPSTVAFTPAPATDFDTIRAAANLDEGGTNIDNNEGVARIPIVIPANTPAGEYIINVSTSTFFDSNAEPIEFLSDVGTITIVPEPAAGVAAVVGGLLMLTRRRRA